MPTLLLTPPDNEPLTLDEAKAFLRVEHDDDDEIIAALVTAARVHVEASARRALMTQDWRLVRDGWPDEGRMPVLPAPVQSVTASRVYDGGALAHGIDAEAFVVDRAGSALLFVPGTLMQPGRAFSGIEIDVRCGYGDDPDDVPEPLRQAVRMLVAHWYETRGIAGDNRTLPQSVAALVAPYRMVAL